MNTPINDLISLYESEGCSFDDIDWVVEMSLHLSKSMQDSHVRCFLYVLAKREQERKKRIKEGINDIRDKQQSKETKKVIPACPRYDEIYREGIAWLDSLY